MSGRPGAGGEVALPYRIDRALADLAAAGADPVGRAVASRRLAEVLFAAGRPEQAQAHLGHAHRIRPHRDPAARGVRLLASACGPAGDDPQAEAPGVVDGPWRDAVAAPTVRRRRARGGARRSGADTLAAPLPTAADLRLDPDTRRALADAETCLRQLRAAAARSGVPGLAEAVLVRDARAAAYLDDTHLALRELLVAAVPGATDACPDALRYLRAARTLHHPGRAGGAGRFATLVGQVAARLAGHPTGTVRLPAEIRRALPRLAGWVEGAQDIPVLVRLAVAYRRLHTLPLPSAAALARLYLTAALGRPHGPGHVPAMSVWIAADPAGHHHQVATATDVGFAAHLAAGLVHACTVEHTLIDNLAATAADLIDRHPDHDPDTRGLLRTMAAGPVVDRAVLEQRAGGDALRARRVLAGLRNHGLVVDLDDHTSDGSDADTGVPGGHRYAYPSALALLAAPHPPPPDGDDLATRPASATTLSAVAAPTAAVVPTVPAATSRDAWLAGYRSTGRWHRVVDLAWDSMHTATDDLDRARAWVRLGRALSEAGRPADALEPARQACTLLRADHVGSPTRGRELAEALLLLSAAHRAHDEPSRAARALHDALALLVDHDEDAAEQVRGLLRALRRDSAVPAPTGTTPTPAGTPAAGPPRSTAVAAWRERRWHDDTVRELGAALDALRGLDRVARHSPLGPALARSARLRELRAGAHLDGAHWALCEVLLHTHTRTDRPTRTCLLDRYLHADAAAHDGPADFDAESLHQVSLAFSEHATATRYLATLAGIVRARRVQRLLDWTAADTGPPAVAKVILGHLHLATTGPRRPGDPVLARAYLGMDLRRLGLLREPWLPLSTWIDRHHRAYRRHLRHAHHTGDVEPFVAFLAAGITRTCRHEARLIDAMNTTWQQLCRALPGHRTQLRERAVADILACPAHTGHSLARHIATTPTAAGKNLQTFVHAGLVVPHGTTTGGRPAFVNPTALRLLTDPPADSNNPDTGRDTPAPTAAGRPAARRTPRSTGLDAGAAPIATELGRRRRR
ncbi:hypothetical protein [Saccharothrix xinjiangensis]|uniref:Uncharacterized protein n=1 Tax=Saccharothrix xinjiangensis TaxID=204798 RepID=A0ABV9XZQ5_9PSEU